VESREEKRARIIAAQAARDAADQASGKIPPPSKARSNWAASPPVRGYARLKKKRPQW